MLFTEHFFLLYFFPLFLLFFLPFRNTLKLSHIIIIIFSLIFYISFGISNLIILLIPLLINYSLGILVFKVKKKRYKKAILFLGVFFDLLILLYYKYFNFAFDTLLPYIPLRFSDNIRALSTTIFPVGISFIVFQRISYLVDIYRKVTKPANNLLHYSTYATVFPHLISGPIVRFVDIKKELGKRKYKAIYLFDGFKFFIVGLALKVIIADGLFTVEEMLKNSIHINNTYESMILISYFSLRLYLDFTGYSLIAMGLAKLIGFSFPYNFNSPYQATSFQDFWNRWNITLSKWLRDYLYIPLGGNRKGNLRTYMNLILTMLLGGLWHGASWNFVIWGGLHGIYLALERHFITNRISLKIPIFFKKILIFIVVSLTWLMFIFTKPQDAITVFMSLISLNFSPFQSSVSHAFLLSLPALITGLLWAFYFTEKDIEKISLNWKNSLLLVIAFFVLLEITFTKQAVPFIYFQF